MTVERTRDFVAAAAAVVVVIVVVWRVVREDRNSCWAKSRRAREWCPRNWGRRSLRPWWWGCCS